MACGCSKNRVAKDGTEVTPSGTYRVYTSNPKGGTRKVYETTSSATAATVAARFAGAKVYAPGEQP